jgi:transposase
MELGRNIAAQHRHPWNLFDVAGTRQAVQRLAEVPGLGVDSAQQIIAEVGATAATFPSPKHLASWMGACPRYRGERGQELQSPLVPRATAGCGAS